MRRFGLFCVALCFATLLVADHGPPAPKDLLDGTPDQTLLSGQAGAAFGAGIGSGDLNGDGWPDLLVGAIDYDQGETDEGALFVYYGSDGGFASEPDRILVSGQSDSDFGACVAAGDLDGDGFDEVIVGAPRYDNGQNNEGAAFVFSGSAGGVAAAFAQRLEADDVGARFGSSCAVGDVNGDGLDDLIVGAHGFGAGGAALVYHGSSSGLSTTAQAVLLPGASGAQFGISVAAGDINADGFDDLVAGANRYQNGETFEGAAFVFLGSAAGVTLGAHAILESNQSLANGGASVAIADLNADAFDDVIVGAPGFDAGEADEGVVLIYDGSALGVSAPFDRMLEFNQAGALFGSDLSAADLSGDGIADLGVGATLLEVNHADEGGAVFYAGSFAGLNSAAKDWGLGRGTRIPLGSGVPQGQFSKVRMLKKAKRPGRILIWRHARSSRQVVLAGWSSSHADGAGSAQVYSGPTPSACDYPPLDHQIGVGSDSRGDIRLFTFTGAASPCPDPGRVDSGPPGGARSYWRLGIMPDLIVDFRNPTQQQEARAKATPSLAGGRLDLIVGSAPGAGHVRGFDLAGQALTGSILPFGPSHQQGVFVAAGRFAAGAAGLGFGTGEGAPTRIRIINLATGTEIAALAPFDPAFTGGARLALADLNADGIAEIVAGSGPGIPARVRIFDGSSQALIEEMTPFGAFAGGVHVAAGDLDGDGTPDIVVSQDAGGEPTFSAFSGLDRSLLYGVEAYASGFVGGVRIAVGDLNSDGYDDVITGPGPGPGSGSGQAPLIKVFSGRDAGLLSSFDAGPFPAEDGATPFVVQGTRIFVHGFELQAP